MTTTSRRRHLQLVTDTPTPLLSAAEIADMGGGWRDPRTGMNLVHFLARFGSPLARRLLGEAATSPPTDQAPRRVR